jgi:hypothetical protein
MDFFQVFSVPLVDMSIFLCQYHVLLDIIPLWCVLRSVIVLFKMALPVQDHLWFHINFTVFFLVLFQ